MIVRTLFILLSFQVIGDISAQDIIFSQYYNSPLHINAAFAGTVAYPHFTTNYRNQWPGLNKVYETYGVTYDQYFPKQNLGLGLIITSDDQANGTLVATNFQGIVSYNMKFDFDKQIKFGIGVGYVQNRLDWDKLIFFDQLDPELGSTDRNGIPFPTSELRPASLSNGYFDVRLGMLYYTPKYYFGVSLSHVNGPYDGFLADNVDATQLSLPALISIHAGFQYVINKDNKGRPTTFISPNVLYVAQSSFHQVNLGAYLQKDALFGGIWLRNTIDNFDALIFSAGVIFNNIKIGYSYDLTISQLGINSGGSHEIGISVGLKNLEKKQSKINDCFSLFR